MKNLIKATVAALCVSTIGAYGAAAQSCTPEHKFETINKGKLTVALTNTPPYSLEDNGAISGIDGDLVKEFAKKNCLDITYEIFTYPAAVSAVQSERADIALGGFYRTAAREKVVTLSNPVYLDQLAVASIEGYDTLDQLKGKKVGTVEGYAWVTQMENELEGSTTYPSSLNLAQDIQSKRIDAGLEGYGAAVVLNKNSNVKVRLLKADPRIKATTDASQTAFLLSKSNEAFINAVNATIEADRSSGKLQEILKKYDLDPSAATVGEAKVIK
ncbi:substrate-binding periplasmic protein [Phyllobacterium sp. SL163]